MNFDEAEAAVRRYAQMSVKEQRDPQVAGKVITAFDIFWRSNPSRHKFAEVCRGLEITPDMLWIMAKVS